MKNDLAAQIVTVDYRPALPDAGSISSFPVHDHSMAGLPSQVTVR
jgi:hypothetical protein